MAYNTDHYKVRPPAWKNILLPISLFSIPYNIIPVKDEFKDLNGDDTGILAYAFDVNDCVHGSGELQHDYMEGTDPIFHVHFQGIVQPNDGQDNIRLQLLYSFTREGIPLEQPQVIETEAAYSTQYAFERIDFAPIDGANLKVRDQLIYKFRRIAASTDEYPGMLLMATIGMYYLVDSLGSASILQK